MLEVNQSFASNLTREYAIACGKNPLKKYMIVKSSVIIS
jgi:hypothetical protein